MNGRCVVFGRLVQGDDVLTSIEKVFTFRGAPARQISIADCGYIEKPKDEINDKKDKK
jgi:cyclophilin family peptidyl-prolyl cis-trans isomerase